MPDWSVGDCIDGRYDVHRVMKGGMGVVYVVFDRESGDVFAAKTFQDEVFASNPKTLERFNREALVWINLDRHVNVAMALQVHWFNKKPFLFLEYVPGGDLQAWIGTPRLTEDLAQAVHFAIQFCDGMSHALGKGVVAHRDIKPQNCLVSDDGTLKVTDFGLAKAFDEGTALPEAHPSPGSPGGQARNLRLGGLGTHTGVGAGTASYMAPEQFRDVKRVDVRADIYSFGVMLYEMCTGSLPFLAHDLTRFAALHATAPIPSLGLANGSDIEAIVTRCLAKQPGNRFSDFGEIRRRLAAVYERLTGKAAPVPPAGQALEATLLADKGVSLDNLGHHLAAIACYDQALAINPRYGLALYNKGNALAAVDDLEAALVCYEQAIEYDPSLALAMMNKGVVLGRLGRVDEQMVWYERALQLNPRVPECWCNRGAVQATEGQHEAALASFERAIELDPGYADAWHGKGNLLASREDWAGSLACFRRTVELNPEDALAWYNRGVIAYELDLTQEMIDCSLKSIALAPSYLNAWINAASGMVTVGRLGDALMHYERALAIDPANELALQGRARVLARMA